MARQQYVDQGGSITAFGTFGYDPIRSRLDLIHRRDALFASQNQSFDDIFSDVVSGNGYLLQQSILSFIRIIGSLEQLL